MSFHSKLKSKLLAQDVHLDRQLNLWRFQAKKIVFTNGCFDILHAGHVEYLAQARDLGQVLIVGLNTDASVKRQGKSPERPINNEVARTVVLSALESVDAIILFDEDTPYELIKRVQPDFLVKAADYTPENIVGYDIVKARGGEVLTIPFVEGFSTTSLVTKIKGQL